MILEIAIATVSAVAASLLLNRLMLVLAPRLGLMDDPGTRRIHSTPVPRAGGIAVWASFMLILVVGLSSGLLPQNNSISWGWLSAFAAGSGLLLVVGVIDDRNGVPALIKLAAHLIAALVFFLIHPVQSGIFPQDWPLWFDGILFVVWAVVLINAFNLIDGLDGLCGGLGALATVALGLLCLVNDRADAALLLFVMAGALAGFLKYNLNPARIFLGDAGSMLIGFFLATGASEAVGKKAVLGIILLPIAVAGVPLLDVLLAVWRRSAKRVFASLSGEQSADGIMSADSDHLHHRILRSVGSQRKAALILQVIAALVATLAFLPLFLGDRLMAFSLVAFIVIGLVGFRYMMKVELEHTGSVIHLAIKLPGPRRRIAAAFFAYDLLALMAASVAAILVETNFLVRGDDWTNLIKFLIIFSVLGSVVLFAIKVHQRLWVRATLRDVLSLQLGLLCAALLSFAFFSMIYARLEWSAFRMAMISFVAAGICISMPRVMLALVRELALEARHQLEKHEAADTGYGPSVVLGSGDMGELFLEHLKSGHAHEYPNLKIIGLLDESERLHGRMMRSFRILGGLSLIPELVADRGLKGVVVAITNPRDQLLEELEALAAEHDLKIYRWRASLMDLNASGADKSDAH